jgi:ligand-binding sensor domain-containing protein
MPFSAFRLTTVLAIFFSFGSMAQQFGYINYSVNDGLLSSTVYCISQDSIGKLWFGTQYGVSVFNGNHFENIDRDQGLKETEVFLTYHDSKERVWLLSFGNNLYYYEKGKVKSVTHKRRIAMDLQFSGTRKVFEDSKGNIWLIGRYLYRVANDTAFEIMKPGIYPFQLMERSDTIYSMGSTGILPVINDTIYPTVYSRPNSIMSSIRFACAVQNKFYIYHQNIITVVQFDNDGALHELEIKHSDYPINRIRFLDNRYLWILTLGGGYCIDFVTNDTLKYLEGKSVSDVLIDKEKNTWLTTLNEGVFRFGYPGVKILDQAHGLSSSGIMSVAGDDKNVWFGTHNGVVYRLNGNNIRKIDLLGLSNNGRVLDMDIGNGELYCATDYGLFSVNINTDKKTDVIPSFGTKSVSASNKMIIAGTPSFGYFISKPGVYRLMWNKRSTSIYIDSDDMLAVGTLEGLYFSGTDSLSTLHIRKNYELNERINYIRRDVRGVLWVATHSAGVFAFDGKKSYRFSRQNGLLSNSCRHVFINKVDNSVWVSTNKGINRITVRDLGVNDFSLTSYTSEDGLPTDDINQCFVRNDTLWAATSNGLAIVPTSKQAPVQRPQIFLNSFIAGERQYINESNVVLPHSSNTVEISFSGLSLSAGKLIKYKYRLAGLDNKWLTTSENAVRYAGLSPGNYKFEVYAIHPKGVLSKTTGQINFVIEKPFWLTWWFASVIIVFLVLSITAIFIYRLKQVRKEERIKNRLLQSEITSLRSQMNPHFIFNSLNSIQDFIFRNEKEYANDYLVSFSSLIRLVLDNSSSNYTTIAKECEFLELYLKLEQLRFNNKFDYEISVDHKLNPELVEIPTMILQPVVENSLLHGIAPKKERSLLKVRFEGDHKSITCSIEDNGVGRKKINSEKIPLHRHSSFGLQAIYDRINILNSMQPRHINFALIDLQDINGLPSGTSVQFTVTQN